MVTRAEAGFNHWTESIKRQARSNLDSSEAVRIAWVNRFKIPRYPSFDNYTPEEALLELWEQYFFEHPDSLEMKGILKRKNAQTGYAYYVTGDPVLDAIEAAFGRGENPDLSVLNTKKGGRDVFREPVFVHTEKGSGFEPGMPVVPQQGLKGVQTAPDGAKITAGGAQVHHTDFSSDELVKAMLAEDTAFKALAAKLGGKGG